MSITQIIANVIAAEGGYVFDPADSGGETNWGITKQVALANGFRGDMKSMPKETAEQIYRNIYIVAPGFDKIIPLSEQIAEELIDTGINMGVAVAAKFLQRALNALNSGGAQYSDLVVDGKLGNASITALKAFLQVRGADGASVLLKVLNALQAVRYVEICENSPKNERFLYGWIRNRVN